MSRLSLKADQGSVVLTREAQSGRLFVLRRDVGRRRMFEGLAEAATALGRMMDPPGIERVVEALVPAVVLKPAPLETRRPGGTHLGGTPDVPAGFEWPRPPVPVDPEEIAKRGNADAAGEMLAHMARNLPYAFIKQVDLEAASRRGEVTRDLPTEGRLLFFYDHAIGPWDTGTRTARVIWDTSPKTSLAPLAMPADLAETARGERDAMVEVRAEFGGAERDAEEGTIYGAPWRASALTATWRMPHPAAIEVETLPEFRKQAAAAEADPEAEAFRQDYEDALETHHDGYNSEERWRRQQLLGSPQPEQGDPRLDAVVVSTFGRQHLSREEWRSKYPLIRAEAETWRLLLQLNVADWMQADFVEGTVFFLIRHDDLEHRRFETVVAVYQQT